jgi:hypothetical protein
MAAIYYCPSNFRLYYSYILLPVVVFCVLTPCGF